MKREEVLKFFEITVKKMKEEHVADLMRANRVEELEEIAKQIDFTILNAYQEENGDLDMKEEEIPKDGLLELTFIINASTLEDLSIIESSYYLSQQMQICSEELEKKIGKLLEDSDIGKMTLEDMLSGKSEIIDEESYEYNL